MPSGHGRIGPRRCPLNLQHDLDRERVYWLQQQPAPASAIEVMAMEWLRREGIEAKALRVGERAPAFRLPDEQGRPVDLDSLLARGPAVLLFYRGHWCPFCTLTLRSYQQAVSRFAALRTAVVAISPQAAAANEHTAQSIGGGMPLLSDVGSHVARAYGLSYDLPAALKGLFEGEYDTQLPEINADGGWTLPVAATYLVGAGGTVLSAQVDVDYRRRADPQAVIDQLVAHYGGDDTAGSAT